MFITQLSENNLYIEANEEKLERAIKELVDNAIKYNKDQGKVILATYEEKNRNSSSNFRYWNWN